MSLTSLYPYNPPSPEEANNNNIPLVMYPYEGQGVTEEPAGPEAAYLSESGHDKLGSVGSDRGTDETPVSGSATQQPCAVCNNDNRPYVLSGTCSCEGQPRERNFFDWVSQTRAFHATQFSNNDIDIGDKSEDQFSDQSTVKYVSDDDMTGGYRSDSVKGDVSDDEMAISPCPSSPSSHCDIFDVQPPEKKLVITNVTCNHVTVTFVESPTKSGFFKEGREQGPTG